MRFPTLANRKGTFLPGQHWAGHELCFFIHDIIREMVASGERSGVFTYKFDIEAEEAASVKESSDIFQWLLEHRTEENLADLLVATMFPAILSDMLHCLYEALECSRKAKLSVSFMLLRKPLQESLYVLEAVIADRRKFAKKLRESPVKLWSQTAGGAEVHRNNIDDVLTTLRDKSGFNPAYLAQLRYDKSAEDGFDAICNKAMHLFTGHKAIETEPMNVNFVFSNWSSKQTQWSFLYSRLPYVMMYMYRIVEAICASIMPTHPLYLADMERRLSAHVLLWGATLDGVYASDPLLAFVSKTQEWLFAHCKDNGYRTPDFKDLVRMRENGAFPAESRWSIWQRKRFLRNLADVSGRNQGSWRAPKIVRAIHMRKRPS